MELKRPGKANPPLQLRGDRRRVVRVVTDTGTPAATLRAGVESERGLRFAGGSEAISTVFGREVDVQVVLRDSMSILLTLFAARSAGRNLITLFFTVNNPGEKFSHRSTAARRREHPWRPPARHCKHPSTNTNIPATTTTLKRKALKRSTLV
jgi:hypothetical protein